MRISIRGIVEAGRPNTGSFHRAPQHIRFPAGGSVTLAIALYTEDGVPFEKAHAADKVVWSCDKAPLGSGIAALKKESTTVDPLAGNTFLIALTPTDTATLPAGLLVFDVWLEQNSGARYQVVPVSSLHVEADLR